MTYKTMRGLEHYVRSYEDMFKGDWKGALRIPVVVPWDCKSELSIDEASGRVIIWIGNDSGGKCYIWFDCISISYRLGFRLPHE